MHRELSRHRAALACNTTTFAPTEDFRERRPRWWGGLFGPLLARRRWQHFAFRLLNEALPHLHRVAAALAQIANNYAAAFAQGNWIILVRRLEHHCQHLFAFYASRRAAEFFRAKALRRRVISYSAAA